MFVISLFTITKECEHSKCPVMEIVKIIMANLLNAISIKGISVNIM